MENVTKVKRLGIVGTGSYLPPLEVDNDTIMNFFETGKPGSWLEERFGIKTRRLDYDFVKGCRPVNAMFDIDLAERAARLALEDANEMEPAKIDHLILVTCTPTELHFMQEAIALHERLGLSRSAKVEHINSGCSGLAKAWEVADTYIRAHKSTTVMVVASNMTSQFINKERYKKNWLPPAVFGDGAGAVIFSMMDNTEEGMLRVFYEIDGSHPLMFYRGGGGFVPTTQETLDAHIYEMDAKDVKEQYPIAMERNLNRLLAMNNFKMEEVKRFYFHQANRWLVEGSANALSIALEKVGINIDRYGNTSAASTLILLDEDRKSGKIKHGDLALFLWVGAGMMSGAAILKV